LTLTPAKWYLPIDIHQRISVMSAIAKVFKHGRSQAVRLPKECRLAGKEVRVTKVGNRLILEPLADDGAMPWALIDQLGDTPFVPEGREQPAIPDDREVFED
jgi:antitoxin VapB